MQEECDEPLQRHVIENLEGTTEGEGDVDEGIECKRLLPASGTDHLVEQLSHEVVLNHRVLTTLEIIPPLLTLLFFIECWYKFLDVFVREVVIHLTVLGFGLDAVHILIDSFE